MFLFNLWQDYNISQTIDDTPKSKTAKPRLNKAFACNLLHNSYDNHEKGQLLTLAKTNQRCRQRARKRIMRDLLKQAPYLDRGRRGKTPKPINRGRGNWCQTDSLIEHLSHCSPVPIQIHVYPHHHDHNPHFYLLARCCPVVSWFMETMAELGCWPPSSSIENKSSGTEHMFVRARTCKWKQIRLNLEWKTSKCTS